MTCLRNILGISSSNNFIGFKSKSAVMAECIKLCCAYLNLIMVQLRSRRLGWPDVRRSPSVPSPSLEVLQFFAGAVPPTWISTKEIWYLALCWTIKYQSWTTYLRLSSHWYATTPNWRFTPLLGPYLHHAGSICHCPTFKPGCSTASTE